MGGIVKTVGNVLKKVPVIGDAYNAIDRPGDILKNPLGTLGKLAGDAALFAGIPGMHLGGTLGDIAQGFNKYAPFAGMMGFGQMGQNGQGGFGMPGMGGQGGGFNPVMAAAMMSNPGLFGIQTSGHYTDGGFGNNASDALKQTQGYGTNLVGQNPGDALRQAEGDYAGAANADSNSFVDPYVKAAFGGLSSLTGVANPYDTTRTANSQDPYALNPAQQTALTNQEGQFDAASQAEENGLRARLSKAGITGPTAEAAVQKYRDSRATTRFGNRAQFGQNAYNARLQTQQMMLPMAMQAGQNAQAAKQQGVGNQYQRYMMMNNRVGQGMNAVGNAGQGYMQLGSQTYQHNFQNDDLARSLMGGYMSGMFNNILPRNMQAGGQGGQGQGFAMPGVQQQPQMPYSTPNPKGQDYSPSSGQTDYGWGGVPTIGGQGNYGDELPQTQRPSASNYNWNVVF